MTAQLPTTLAPYLLAWAVLAVLAAGAWVAYFEWVHRGRRHDERAMRRSVGRVIRDAQRGADFRSWR